MRRLLILCLTLFGTVSVSGDLRAGSVTFAYTGTLDRALGNSPTGTPFSGQFAYAFPQTGTTTPFFGGTQSVFTYSVLTMTLGGQTVTENPGQLTLYNNVNPPQASGVPVGDSLYTFLPTSALGPAPSSGSFPGLTPNYIYLGFVDTTGTAFSGPSLPASLALPSFTEAFVGVNYGPPGTGNTTVVFPLSSLTSVTTIPEPASITLLGIGLVSGAVALRRLGRRSRPI